eukprot:5013828-Amphidinium_carterae.1
MVANTSDNVAWSTIHSKPTVLQKSTNPGVVLLQDYWHGPLDCHTTIWHVQTCSCKCNRHVVDAL